MTSPETNPASSATTGGWAVLGPGQIARRFLADLSSTGGGVVAVGSSDPGRARTFADEAEASGDADVFAGSYEEALADPRVRAVYVSAVHTAHPELVSAAIRAGKAVLCEKPLSANEATTAALVSEARGASVPLVEAYMYRFHPQTRAVLDLVRDGAIGRVLHIDAAFAFAMPEREGRLFDPAVAGGGILDVGGYPVTMAAAIVDAAEGMHAAEPLVFAAAGVVGPTGVDEWAVARATYRGGITATLSTGVRVNAPNDVTILGEKGFIRIAEPWTPTGATTIELATADGGARVIEIDAAPAYALEARAVLAALADGTGEAAEMTHAETLATVRTLDRWRSALGVRFPFETE